MFLIERLIGVGIYASLLILVCLYINGKKLKSIKRTLFFYALVLSILAFFYTPYETADLYRIYESIRAFQKYTFEKFWDVHIVNSDAGLSKILYWIVGKTGTPQLLPSTVAFVCYNCIFYIICKTAETNKISGKNIAITVFFYMTTETYLSIIGGIRCMLGVCLLAFCFYRENYEKRFNIIHIPIYAFSFFIHAFSAILIILRFVIPAFSGKKSFLKRIIYILLLGITIAFSYQYIAGYLESVISKAEDYLENTAYSYFWGYMIDIVALFTMMSVLFRSIQFKKKENIEKLSVMWMYLLVCLISAIVFCFEYSIFTRLILHISPIICLPILMTVLQYNDEADASIQHVRSSAYTRIRHNYNSMFMYLSLVLLFLSCIRGETSSLKFFVL